MLRNDPIPTTNSSPMNIDPNFGKRLLYRLPLPELYKAQCERERVRGHEVLPPGSVRVDLRTDWDGVTPGYGSLEVQMAPESWKPLPNPQPLADDLISFAEALQGQTVTVHVERGDQHPDVEFQVCARPVTWNIDDQTLDATQNTEFVAEYDTHYTVSDPTKNWTSSSYVYGAHRAELDLQVGVDYEIWVRLKSPVDPGEWLEQDPIVRTGGTGPR